MKIRQAKKIITNTQKYHIGFDSVLCDNHIPNKKYEAQSIKYFLKNSAIGKINKYIAERNHTIKKAIIVWKRWYGKMHVQNSPIINE